MQLDQPSLRRVPRGQRADFERIYDLAASLRTDETVERITDEWARRESSRCQPGPGHALQMTCRPRGTAARFRALFRTDPVGVMDAWIDAGSTSNISSKVYGLIDRIDPSHLFVQSTASIQSPLPVADASMANALTIALVAASWYESTRAKAAWQRFTNGTGAEVTTVFAPTSLHTGMLIGNSDLADVGTIAFFSFLTSAPAINTGVYNAGSVAFQKASGAYATNVPTYYTDAWLMPNAEHFLKETALPVTAVTGTPATGTPTYAMRMGGASTGNYWLQGRWRASYLFHRVLTAAERAVRQAFIVADTGIT
jgi:hypothetical protein